MTDDDLAAALIAIWFLLSLLPYLFFFGGGKVPMELRQGTVAATALRQRIPTADRPVLRESMIAKLVREFPRVNQVNENDDLNYNTDVPIGMYVYTRRKGRHGATAGAGRLGLQIPLSSYS